MAVIKLDRKRRAWKDLFDAAVDFKRRLFGIDAVCFDVTGFCRAIASSDNNPL